MMIFPISRWVNVDLEAKENPQLLSDKHSISSSVPFQTVTLELLIPELSEIFMPMF